MKCSLFKPAGLILSGVVCFQLFGVKPVQAIPVNTTFDFTDIDGSSGITTLSLSQGDINLDVDGATYWDTDTQHGFALLRFGWLVSDNAFNGLGVYTGSNNGPSSWMNRDSKNSDQAEFMVFKFNKDVKVVDILYEIDGVDIDNAHQIDFAPQYAYDINGDGKLQISNQAPTGLLSRVGITTRYAEYGMAVNSITVSSDSPLSTIPLPASMPLYGAGIGVLGLLGWYRRQRHTNA